MDHHPYAIHEYWTLSNMPVMSMPHYQHDDHENGPPPICYPWVLDTIKYASHEYASLPTWRPWEWTTTHMLSMSIGHYQISQSWVYLTTNMTTMSKDHHPYEIHEYWTLPICYTRVLDTTHLISMSIEYGALPILYKPWVLDTTHMLSMSIGHYPFDIHEYSHDPWVWSITNMSVMSYEQWAWDTTHVPAMSMRKGL